MKRALHLPVVEDTKSTKKTIEVTEAVQSVFGDALEFVTFQINHAVYVGISEDVWSSTKLGRDDALNLRKMIQGRISINGVRHIVLASRTVGTNASTTPLAATLTQREFQVASLIATGAENKEIARTLGISHFTVREHVRRIFHKLRLSKRSAIGGILSGTILPQKTDN
jgi:DNA-binding CsgD family transcriptional regulator